MYDCAVCGGLENNPGSTRDIETGKTVETDAQTYDEWKAQHTDSVGSPLAEQAEKKAIPITQKSIDSILEAKIPGYSDEECKYIQEQHKELLGYSRSKNDGKEVSFAFSQDLQKRQSVLGSETGAYANMQGLGNNVFVMHNHPRNSSYSTQDIIFMLGNDNVRALSIVKHSGNIEILQKTDKYIAERAKILFARAIKSIDSATNSEYNKAVSKFIKQSVKERLICWIKK